MTQLKEKAVRAKWVYPQKASTLQRLALKKRNSRFEIRVEWIEVYGAHLATLWVITK